MKSTAKLIPQITSEQQENFWRKVDKNGPTEKHMETPCWLWTASTDRKGYGQVNINRNLYRSHRIAYTLVNGPLQDTSQHLCHRCDIPLCVNPNHLFLGNNFENSMDRVAKGRSACGDRHGSKTHPERVARGNRHGSVKYPEKVTRGELNPMSKITANAVAEIRKLHLEGKSHKWLSEKYKLATTSISRIITRKRWAHIP